MTQIVTYGFVYCCCRISGSTTETNCFSFPPHFTEKITTPEKVKDSFNVTTLCTYLYLNTIFLILEILSVMSLREDVSAPSTSGLTTAFSPEDEQLSVKKPHRTFLPAKRSKLGSESSVSTSSHC